MNSSVGNFQRRIQFAPVVLALICTFLASARAQEPVTRAKPTAIKVFEIGRVSNRKFIGEMERFWKIYDPETQLYIINYGSAKEIARREKVITNPYVRLPHERSRITLVRGGFGKGPATVIWKVPYGADNPVP